MIHLLLHPFVSSEVETRKRNRVSTSLDTNGLKGKMGESCR